MNFDLTCHPTWDQIRLYVWLWFQWDDVFPATEKCRYHRVHTSPRISCRTQSSQEWRISRENTALARGNVTVCSLENRVFPSFWRQRHRRPTRTSAPKAVWTRKEKENSGLVQKKKTLLTILHTWQAWIFCVVGKPEGEDIRRLAAESVVVLCARDIFCHAFFRNPAPIFSRNVSGKIFQGGP